MKIFITGASGFVGSHLCERFIKDGHTVYALVRDPNKLQVPRSPRLILIKGDLDHESLSWIQELPSDLDKVVHTAGIVHNFNTSEFFRVNSTGTLHLILNLKERFKDLHFVLISSLAAGGPSLSHQKRNEDDLDLPVSLYGKSKKEAETIIHEHAPKNYKISVIRPPMVIGPRDTAVLDIFKMVKSRIILLPGVNSLKKSYSFVCVFDLVETITRVLSKESEQSFYSSHPSLVTFQEIISTIKKVMGKRVVLYLPMPIIMIRLVSKILELLNRFFPLNVRLTPDKVFELEALNWTCDGHKSEVELSQTYKYDLVDTIQVTYDDYKKSNWL